MKLIKCIEFYSGDEVLINTAHIVSIQEVSNQVGTSLAFPEDIFHNCVNTVDGKLTYVSTIRLSDLEYET